MRRFGLVGGTFDPVHRAHTEIPLALAEGLDWEKVIFIPAWRQPFKGANSSPFHRHAMVVLATRELDAAEISLLEIERESISYTIETLRRLSALHPDVSLEWVIGEDNAAELPRWKEYRQLFDFANFVILRRTRGATELPQELQPKVCHMDDRPAAGAIVFAENRSQEISSTGIRERVREGRSIEGLVHPDVMHYIEKNGLYLDVR